MKTRLVWIGVLSLTMAPALGAQPMQTAYVQGPHGPIPVTHVQQVASTMPVAPVQGNASPSPQHYSGSMQMQHSQGMVQPMPAVQHLPAPMPAVPVHGVPNPVAPAQGMYMQAQPMPGMTQPVACRQCMPAPMTEGWHGQDMYQQGGCEGGDICSCLSGFYVGAGVYVLRPTWSGNPAFITIAGSGGVTNTTQTDFEYKYGASPLLWMGYVGSNGLGARLRYWHFDQNTGRSFTTAPGDAILSARPMGIGHVSVLPGNNLSFSSSLKLNTYDVELMQNFRGDQWDFVLSGGLRHGNVSQKYIQGSSTSGTVTSVIDSGHSFNGTGLTVAGEMRRRLWFSNFALYTNLRGSLLYGVQSQQLFQAVDGTLANAAFAHQDDFVPIGEIELGLEWGREVGRSYLFLTVAAVGQCWFGVGNSANNATITGLANGVTSIADDTNLGLIGIMAQSGLRF